jgi:predicted phosphohydrolase
MEQSENFAHVIYILGNHEFYPSDLDTLPGEVEDKLADCSKVSFLDNSSVVIEGVHFIGSTLWSDMDNENPTSMWRIEQSLNDYHCIRKGGDKIFASDTIDLFKKNMAYLDQTLSESHDGPTVVVTHHGPSFKSVHPLYQESGINGAFASNCERLMYDHDIDYWLQGHTHQTSSYEVNGCKVRMNPFGYGAAENLHFDPLFRVEL